MWYRQEGHIRRSCRTANDSRISTQGEDSDTGAEAEVEIDAEAIVGEIPMRRRGSRERRGRE